MTLLAKEKKVGTGALLRWQAQYVVFRIVSTKWAAGHGMLPGMSS